MDFRGVIESTKGFVQPIVSWMQDLLGGIPRLAWLCLFLGLLLIVGTFFLVQLFLQKERIQPQEKQDEKDEERALYKLPPLGGWMSEFLSKKGFFKVGRLSIDFLNSLSFLESTLKCSNYKYKNPWVMLVGSENSGKTTLLRTLQSLKANWQAERGAESDTECNWFFLRSGVILDVKGKLFLENETIRADEVGWNALKNLLIRYRSAKPLDSLVVTLSMEDLYGKGRLSSLQCLERAKFIAQKLSSFQDQLGLKIPVYVVITKADLVPGFQSFCQALPLSTKQNMLGWSAPYTLETAYSPYWVKDLFQAVTDQICHIGMDIFCADMSSDIQDSLFVFPHELSKIKDNLEIYLNQIFQTGAYRSTLLLRGVYFCGDSDRQPLEASQTQFIDRHLLEPEDGSATTRSLPEKEEDEEGEANSPPMTGLAEGDRASRIFFFGDVVYNKILMESALCVPQKGKYFAGNKSVKILKISSASLLIFGGTGLYFAYRSFEENKALVSPSLTTMYRFLTRTQKMPLLELSKKNAEFEASIRKLSAVMNKMSEARFFSLFIPASWFSPLQSKLNEAINVAYQNVIIRALYVNLLLKAREWLHFRVESIPLTTSLAQLAIPTKSYEFIALNDFVLNLTKLSEYVEKFNDLRLVASPRVLSELVDYAFKITLPTSFLQAYGKMRHSLATSSFPAIDLTVYKNLAVQTFSKIFQRFFNTIFMPSYQQSFPNQLAQMIQQLRQVNGALQVDVEQLRTLAKDFETVLQFFEQGVKNEKDNEVKVRLNWMDKDAFEPDEEFDKFLDAVDASPFLGPDISQAVVNNCAVGLYHLKRSLKEITQLLTTDFRVETNPAQPDEEHPCSEGLLILGRALKELFAEPYMKRASGHQFINVVPEGQLLYWDDKLLKAACELCEQYEVFATKKVGGLPVLLQENFRLLAREGLQRQVMSIIARSQNFLSAPVSAGQQALSEESIRSQATNVRQVGPLFLKLLEILNHEAVSFFYISLRDLLLTSNYKLLDKINSLMKKVGPYHIWDPSFSWWNGKENPAYPAYGVKDAQDLNIFLDIQGQHVVNLAITLAKPVVDLLTSDIMLTANPLNRAQLTKWKRIVAQTEAYQNKQPGSSIAQLEQFITTTLKSYKLDNIFEEIKQADLQEDGGDHFLETITFLKKGILGRAEVLTRQQNLKNYNELAKFFNDRLRGRFPFTPPSNDTEQGVEADPEDVRLFLEMFKKAGGSAEKILDQIYQLGLIAKPAVLFLRNVEQIADLFGEYLANHGQGLPFILTEIIFNVNRERSRGGNYVAEWSFKCNDDERITQTTKVKQTKWVYGCPTELSFRWPDVNGMPELPSSDPKQTYLKVEGTTATYSFGGNWSLFRAQRKLQALPSDLSGVSIPNAAVFKGTIPVSADKSAILFSAISLLGPSENPNIAGKTLSWPKWPTLAPTFGPELDPYVNAPILSSGAVTPATLESLK